jgi:hypothetical protein
MTAAPFLEAKTLDFNIFNAQRNIRMEATRRNLRARLKILKKISDCQINQSKRKFSQKKYV